MFGNLFGPTSKRIATRRKSRGRSERVIRHASAAHAAIANARFEQLEGRAMLAALPPGTTYTETFDGIGTALPAGWTVRTSATTTALGTAGIFTTPAIDWANTGGAFKNFASADGLTSTDSATTQAASTDRALGIRQTGSFANSGAAFTFEIDNTTGKSNFSLSMKHQMLSVQGRSTIWTVQYSTNGGTAWTDLGTYTDPGVFGSTTGTYSFGSAIDDLATPVFVRIVTLAATTGSGSRDSYGIDDFSLSWTNLNPNEPTILVSGSATPFLTTEGTPSAAQTFPVNGSNLTADLTATAPAGFEVSSDGVTYGSTAIFSPTGGSVTGTLSVRLAASTPWGSPSGSVTLSSTGAQSATVTVAGVVRPLVVTLPYGPANFETTSEPWVPYSVAGSANWSYTTSTLGGGGTTAPANKVWQMNGFGSDVNADDWLMIGPFDFTGVSNPMISFSTLNRFATIGINDTELKLKASTNYSGSGDPSAASWTEVSFPKPTVTMTMTPTGRLPLAGVANQSGVYLAFHYVANGTTNGTTAVWQVDDVTVESVASPVIIGAATAAPFSTVEGTASAAQTFPVSGTNLQGDITATAPVGFEVSSDGTTFGATATIANVGGSASGAISVRVAATAAVGPLTGNVALSTPGGSDVSIALSGSVRPLVVPLPLGPQDLETNSEPWFTYSAAGTKNWSYVTSTLGGGVSTAPGNKAWEMNGFSSVPGDVPANDWLMIGPFDFTSVTNPLLTFNTLNRFTATQTIVNELQLKASSNFTGTGDPSVATWTTYSFAKPATELTKTSSGDVVLTGMAGQSGVYVAFHYTAAGTTSGTTALWQVDDIQLRNVSVPPLTVTAPASITEVQVGAQGTVSIPVALGTDLIVSIASGDSANLLVGTGGTYAATTDVTIPAGQTSATFDIRAVANTTVTTNVTVTLTASVGDSSHSPDTADVTVVDVPIADLTSGGYTQDFATFAAATPALPAGWSAVGPVLTFPATDNTWGAGTSGGYRGGANVFGYQHTSSASTLQQILTLRNATGAELTELTVRYDGRVARPAETRLPAFTVTVAGQAVPALAYSTGDGDGAVRVASLTGLAIPVDGVFQVIWSSDRDTVNTGSSRQIGISNVSVSAGVTAFPPVVSGVTVPITTVARTTAAVSASVTGDGGSTLTARGFVFSVTSENAAPEIGGQGVTTIVDPAAAVGAFNSTLTGLTAATGYTVRAYATNDQGTTYSLPVTFTTANPAASFTGNYTQTFSTYAGTLPIGWNAVSSTGLQTYGGEWNTTNSAAGFRGVGTTETAGVLGYQHTAGTGTLTASLILVNDTGAPLSELTIGYLGRVGRASETRTPEWTVAIDGTAVPALAYSTGNTAGVGGVAADQQLSVTLPVSIAAGAEFTLTWVSTNGLESQTGASRQIGIGDVQVSANVAATPTLGTTGTLSAFSTTYGTASSAQTVSVTGSNLSGDITATAPTGFEVSSDGTTFGPTATFPQAGGAASGTLSVRLAATTAAGTWSGDVSLASAGATAMTVAIPSSTVAKKTLTVTANDASRLLDEADPTFTATITGFVNGETAAVVSGAAVLSTAATGASPAGAYAITAATGTLAATNYDFSFVAGTLTVTDEVVFDVAVGQTVTYSTARSAALKYIKRGLGTLVLDAASSHTGLTTVEAGTLVVAHGDALASSAVRVVTGGTLKVNAALTMRSPTVTLAGGTLDGTGAAILVNATTGIATLAITSGSVTGSPALTVSGNGVVTLPTDRRQIVDVTSLSIDQAGGGRIDIGKGRINIAVGGTTEADLRADLMAGRAGGTFAGTSGIMTTGGKASPASLNPVVGYRVLGTGAAIVAWAAFGDSNLDGQVNLTDINLINSGGKFGQGSSTGATWSQGDYNYSGGVLLVDINLLNGTGLYLKGSYLPVPPLGGQSLVGSSVGTGSISQQGWIALALDAQSQTGQTQQPRKR